MRGLTFDCKIASLMSMKSWRRFVLLVAVSLVFLCRQMFAQQEVTFEILGSFDYPGAVDTYATGSNDRGDVAGYFLHSTNRHQGFVRFADGTFSEPIVHPDAINTNVRDINNAGTMCGFYSLLDGTYRGFLLSGSTFTNIDVGWDNTFVTGVNDAGNFCGYTETESGQAQAFVSIDGTITTFSVPRTSVTRAEGINNLNQVVGWTVDHFGNGNGFRRDADGTLNWPIRAEGLINSFIFGLDDKGRMVGSGRSDPETGHLLFLRPSHRFAFFDYPGAPGSLFYGVNNRGQICGYYQSADFRAHGFVVRVRRADE